MTARQTPRMATMQQRRWRPQEDAYLRDRHLTDSTEAMALALQRTREGVQKRLKALGIEYRSLRWSPRNVVKLLATKGYSIDFTTVIWWIQHGYLRTAPHSRGKHYICDPADVAWLAENYRYRDTNWDALKALTGRLEVNLAMDIEELRAELRTLAAGRIVRVDFPGNTKRGKRSIRFRLLAGTERSLWVELEEDGSLGTPRGDTHIFACHLLHTLIGKHAQAVLVLEPAS